MDNDPSRAALAIACVFAVVLGASLFPATGFGTNPVPAGSIGNGGSEGAGGSSVPTTGTGTTNTATEEPSTVTATTTEAADTGTTAGARTTDQSEPTTTGAAGGSGDGTTTTGAAGGSGDGTTTTPPGHADSAAGGESGAWLAFATIVFGTGIAFVGGAVGFGRHHRRRYPADWDLPQAPHLRVLAYVRRIPQTSLAFVLFAGTNAPGILDGLADGVANATSGFGAATTGLAKLGSVIGTGLVKVPGGFVAAVGGLGRGLGSLTLGLSSLSTSFGSGGFVGSGEDRPADDPRSGADASAASDPEPGESDPPASVLEAWERLQEDLGVSGRDGQTPGEIARRAIGRGMPTDAIRSLTRTFRDVRYGGHPDGGDRVTVARDAYERVRSALDGESS